MITGTATNLPRNSWLSLYALLRENYELTVPVTRSVVLELSRRARVQEDLRVLRAFATTDYDAKVTNKRKSLLELLEDFPSIDLPLEKILNLLPTMRPRH